MDRLEELHLVAAIAEGGSLAAAGRRLGQAPPAVTRTLAALEERLGVRLFERTTRKVRATQAGQRLAAQAQRLLHDYDEAMAEAAGEARVPRGRLRVAAPLVFGRRHVAPIVTAFLDAEPLVSVDLALSDRNADLIDEGIDVAVRIGTLQDAALMAQRVGTIGRVLAASPAYLARYGTPAVPEDLAAHETVLFAPFGGAPEWRFADRTVAIMPRLTVNAAEAAVAAAVAGRGITLALSYQVADELAHGQLVRLLPEHEAPSSPVHFVFPSARLLAPRTRAFLDFAAPQLSALDVLR